MHPCARGQEGEGAAERFPPHRVTKDPAGPGGRPSSSNRTDPHLPQIKPFAGSYIRATGLRGPGVRV